MISYIIQALLYKNSALYELEKKKKKETQRIYDLLNKVKKNPKW